MLPDNDGDREPGWHGQSHGAQVTGDMPSLLDLLTTADTGSKLDLRSSHAQSYINRLASLGLDDLQHEPAIITNERGTVDTELVNLCYREYPTFTSVHRCSAAVGSAFDDFETSLGDLIDSIPDLEQECRDFSRNNAAIQASRRKAVLLQEHEAKLLDVLEIPQLMDTCVRIGYYQEALDLTTHVKSLSKKVSCAVIKDVAEEVEGILQLMTAQLLGVLREPVKLPALLKAVNYLRRLQSLHDTDLGLVFLSSRLDNYRARLVEIEKDRADPVRYLRRYIDLFREHVFDIISQYTIIFAGTVDDQIAVFAELCIEDLVDLVRRYIPRLSADAASMSSIMVQLGYCSLSFSRVGLDFSHLLAEPFASAISSSFDQAVSVAADVTVELFAANVQSASSPSSFLLTAQELQNVLSDPKSPPAFVNSPDRNTPSAVLTHYPPLAQFVNAHLASLNALRLLAPFQLMPSLISAQTRSIRLASEALLSYVEQIVSLDGSRELARSSSGSRHHRTGSSPRAHLLRRNTETQMSMETLAARRKETKRVCVAFVSAWIHATTFLRDGLADVMESVTALDAHGFRDCMDSLETWVSENKEDETPENRASHIVAVDEEEPKTHNVAAVATTSGVIDAVANDGPRASITHSIESPTSHDASTRLRELDQGISSPTRSTDATPPPIEHGQGTGSVPRATAVRSPEIIGDDDNGADRGATDPGTPITGHDETPNLVADSAPVGPPVSIVEARDAQSVAERSLDNAAGPSDGSYVKTTDSLSLSMPSSVESDNQSDSVTPTITSTVTGATDKPDPSLDTSETATVTDARSIEDDTEDARENADKITLSGATTPGSVTAEAEAITTANGGGTKASSKKKKKKKGKK